MSQDNPWKTLGTRCVYSNPWITVREDSVIRPDGDPGIYSVVDTRIATGAVALTEDHQVYLVGQYRYPTNIYSWEIPEGGTDNDEKPLDCIKRELQEEAGIRAAKWTQLGSEIHLSNCFSSEVGYLYLAQELQEVEAAPDGTEVLEVKTVALEECLRMVHSGEITDAMTIIALMRVDLLIRGDQ